MPEHTEQPPEGSEAGDASETADPAADGAWMRTWLPGDAGTPPGGDGFFAARLRRRTDTEGTENEA